MLEIKHLVIALVCLLLCTCTSPPHSFQQALLPKTTATAKPTIQQQFAIEINEERVLLTKAYFEAHNQKLFQQLPKENSRTAIEFIPKIIVVHFTAITTLAETMTYFQPNRIAGDRGLVTDSGALNVGVQFVVDQDGTIYQSYPDNVMSRHVIGLNHVAIGIENIGNADLGTSVKGEQVPLTEAQLAANVSLIQYLQQKYPTLKFMIGHFEYRDLENPDHPAHALFTEDQANYRTEKIDPGKRFLKALRQALESP